jgi:hypothetical protein
MKPLTTLLLSVCLFAGQLNAQNPVFSDIKLSSSPRCGFADVLERIQYPYPEAMQEYKNIIANTKAVDAIAKTTGVVYDIPVVIHVVYNTNTPQFNLPDSVLINQISVLNKAFRKQHSDTGNTRAIFKPLSHDAEIQFHLATKDPLGNATSGITRTVSSRFYFGASVPSLDSLERVKSTATGGIDPWPTNKYLNIWVANLTDAQGNLSVLGYAIPPFNPVPSNWPGGVAGQFAGLIDGVVIQPHAFGNNNSLSSQLQGTYTKGRCTVHEVGHYLGLMHTFGSGDGSSTANCGPIADDGIADTPEQSLISQLAGGACPAATKNSCGAGSTGDQPDMWENYMDYTVDACQTLFTDDQVIILRSVMANQRNSLVGTTGMDAVRKNEVFVYPNPASHFIQINCPQAFVRAEILSFNGSIVASYKCSPTMSKQFDITELPAGNYILKLATANGDVYLGKFITMK